MDQAAPTESPSVELEPNGLTYRTAAIAGVANSKAKRAIAAFRNIR